MEQNGTEQVNQVNGPTHMDPIRGVEAYVASILQCVMRGILTAFPNIPAPIILAAIVRCTGFLVAGSLDGPLTNVLGVRKMFKEEFDKGIQLAKVRPGKMPDPANETAPFQPRG